MLQLSIVHNSTIEVEAASAGDVVRVKHGLGRPVAGWLVVDRNSDIGFYRQNETYEARQSNNELMLVATAAGRASLVMIA